MSEAKSPSFNVVFSTVVKVFLAVVLLIVILWVAVFATWPGILNMGTDKKTEQTTSSTEKVNLTEQEKKNLKQWGFE